MKNENAKSKKKICGLSIIVLFLSLLLTLGSSYVLFFNEKSHEGNSEETGRIGVIAGEGDVNMGGIDWGRNEVSGPELSFSVNVNPKVDLETQEGNFTIVNPEVNDLAMIAEIYLKDEPDILLYRSPVIPPYSHIKNATLTYWLDEGEYDAICFLNGVTNEEDPQYVGRVGVNMKIKVN